MKKNTQTVAAPISTLTGTAPCLGGDSPQLTLTKQSTAAQKNEPECTYLIAPLSLPIFTSKFFSLSLFISKCFHHPRGQGLRSASHSVLAGWKWSWSQPVSLLRRRCSQSGRHRHKCRSFFFMFPVRWLNWGRACNLYFPSLLNHRGHEGRDSWFFFFAFLFVSTPSVRSLEFRADRGGCVLLHD